MALSMIDPRQMTDEQRNLVLGKILPDSVPPTQPANTAPQPGPLTPVEPAKPKEGALSPVDQRMQHDTQKLQDLQNYKHLGEQGSTHPGTLGKIGHVFSTIGNTVGNVLAPGVMEMTPGTTAHRYAQIGQLKRDIAGEQQQKLQGAEAEKNLASADALRDPGAKLHPLEQAQQAVADEAKRQGKNPMEILDMLRQKAESSRPDVVHAYSAALAKGDTVEAERLAPLVKQFVENSHAPAGDKTPPHITVMQDGKPHIMERDPQTGEYSVDRGIAPPNFAMVAPEIRTVQVKDDKTGKDVVKTISGKTLGDLPDTSTTRTMAEMAGTVTEKVPQLQQEIDGLAQKIGPGVGRWNQWWVNGGGANDPEFASLDTALDLFASAVVRTHFGARGGQEYRQELRKQFSEAQSPQDLKARIAAADQWISKYAGMTGNKPAGGAAPQRPANVPAGYVFQENGPHGRGWYKPNAAQR